MRSHNLLRAGLVAFTLALCALLVSAVPVPSTSLSCSDHPQPCLISKRDLSFTERSDIDFELDSRAPNPVPDNLSVRDDLDQHVTLVRRKSIFTKIKDAFKKVGKGIKNVAKKIGNGIKNVAKKVGNGIKTAAKKVASGVKTAAKKVASGVKTAAKKVASGVKTAAKKVGHFVKTTGAKVAKFGLKVISTAQSVASKVAKFIPVIGKPLSAGLNLASTATNAASNAIHANLGKKLEKGMKIMDKVRNPVSGAAGAVIGALKRDLDESEIKVLSREWDSADLLEMREDYLDERGYESYELEARDEEPELDARDESHEWEAREWNEWEERDWEQWDTREWENEYEM